MEIKDVFNGIKFAALSMLMAMLALSPYYYGGRLLVMVFGSDSQVDPEDSIYCFNITHENALLASGVIGLIYFFLGLFKKEFRFWFVFLFLMLLFILVPGILIGYKECPE